MDISLSKKVLKKKNVRSLTEPSFVTNAHAHLPKTNFIAYASQGADKIIVMRDGVAVEEGKHEELLQRPNGAYRALVKLQQQQV